MIAFYRVLKDCTFEFCKSERLNASKPSFYLVSGFKQDIDFVPSFTQLRVLDDRLFWLVFGVGGRTACYEVNTRDEVSAFRRIYVVGKIESFRRRH